MGHASTDPSDATRSFTELSDAASAAWAEGRVADAIGCFATLRHRFPDRAEPFVDSAVLLAEIGCLAEAEIVLAAARARFPMQPAIIAAQAELAGEQGHLLAALDHWTALRAADATDPEGVLAEAATLADHGAFATAEALLEAACIRFPDDTRPWIAAARVAAARPDPAAAERRLAAARARFGDDPRLDAPETLTPALLDGEILLAAATDAAAGERWTLAADICRTLRERYPDQLLGFTEGAAAAAAMGDDTAAALLDEAERRFGTSPELTLARAQLAAAQQDWTAAIAGFEAARAMRPDDAAPVVGLVRSLRAAGHADAADKALAFGLRHLPDSVDLRLERARSASSPPTAHPVVRPTPAGWTAARRLLAGFVSLGAAQDGGELARLRRAHGLTERGLLDDAELGPESLAAMLQARFDGVGAPEHTDLRTFPPIAEGEAPSWALADRRGWFVTRTTLSPAAFSELLARALGSAWARAGAAALATELRSGRRCFVYRMTAPASASVLDGLRHALRGRRLILLRDPDAAHPAGSVTREPGGLLIGHVPPLHTYDEAEGADRIACWLDVLAAAARDEVRTAVVVEDHAGQLLETA